MPVSDGLQNQYVWPQTYRPRFSASRGGHAPGNLRDALIEALDSSFCSDVPWWENLEIEFFAERKRLWWAEASYKAKALWLLGQLWNCTDIVPGEICRALDLRSGKTYAQLARSLKAELTESRDLQLRRY